jgi:hypothetical protein
MINGPGVSTPEISYGLATDPSQEPTIANHLTPLGQRQQYLIGTELRTRYTQADYYPNVVIDSDYNVNQTKMQTPFVGRNILSMQAQMMGMFPASQTTN